MNTKMMGRQSKEMTNHRRRPVDVYLIYLNKMYPVLLTSGLFKSTLRQILAQHLCARKKKNPEIMMLLVANVTESIK